VWHYIGQMLAKNNGSVWGALKEVTELRKVLPLNVDLAAAEHYFFARYLVEDLHWPRIAVIAEVEAYGAAKALDMVPSFTKDVPPTPTSADQRRWGVWGAEDVEMDPGDLLPWL
jgi:hypothetical protein